MQTILGVDINLWKTLMMDTLVSAIFIKLFRILGKHEFAGYLKIIAYICIGLTLLIITNTMLDNVVNFFTDNVIVNSIEKFVGFFKN